MTEPHTDADEAAVKTIVEAVATCVDRHDFLTLETLYADEVTRDYTSLNGGEPEVTTNRALMARWAAHLPGFDRTRHNLSNLSAEVKGDVAIARADVVADHWIDELMWTVSGRHTYHLARYGRQWRITAQIFDFAGEKGSREAAKRAGAAAAAANSNPYILREQARAAVLELLRGLEAGNMQRVADVWSEDAVEERPGTPGSQVTGRDALVLHYSSWPDLVRKARLTDDIRFHPTDDPSTLVVEFQSEVEWYGGNGVCAGSHIAIVIADRARIRLLRHYGEPILRCRGESG